MSESIRVPLVQPGTRPELAEVEATIRSERGGEIAVLYRATVPATGLPHRSRRTPSRFAA